MAKTTGTAVPEPDPAAPKPITVAINEHFVDCDEIGRAHV